MAENSKIEWCDHTHNFWTGCEDISPACAHCYAAAWAKRAGRDFAERKRTTVANWMKPFKWQKAAEAFFHGHGHRQRVFTNSLADFFDNKVPQAWRDDAYATMRATPDLDWLILTKRIGNAKRMLPADWGTGYPNVWLGSTVVNQEEVDRDVVKLLGTPARVRFLSCEPLLGPLDLEYPEAVYPGGPRRCCDGRECGCMGRPIDPPLLWGIDWVIAGGESGGDARPAHPQWIRLLRDQCKAISTAFLFKQWGEWAPWGQLPATHEALTAPEHRRHTFDDGTIVERLGKRLTGRLLDGSTLDEFPKAAA